MRRSMPPAPQRNHGKSRSLKRVPEQEQITQKQGEYRADIQVNERIFHGLWCLSSFRPVYRFFPFKQSYSSISQFITIANYSQGRYSRSRKTSAADRDGDKILPTRQYEMCLPEQAADNRCPNRQLKTEVSHVTELRTRIRHPGIPRYFHQGDPGILKAHPSQGHEKMNRAQAWFFLTFLYDRFISIASSPG